MDTDLWLHFSSQDELEKVEKGYYLCITESFNYGQPGLPKRNLNQYPNPRPLQC